MTWNNITLGKYQQIDKINGEEQPDIDKVLFITCVIFDMTEYEMDNTEPAKAVKMMAKMQSIFETPFSPKSLTKIGRYVINYDVSKMTFGQYVELAFFLADKTKITQYAHYIMATISRQWHRKHTAKDHRKKANYFLSQPVDKVIGCVNRIVESFNQFNVEYKGLFGVDKSVSGDVQDEEFIKRYGWIYSATQVAKHEGITQDAAYALPVRQALNDLGFIKAKAKYEADQLRTSNKSIV